ncbi:hypothetical protein [Geobacillus subterraneus]|uniref:hypothetical protein n=1 Tax=Geobacillus subterraneus TaxID=129338 RepID=UPI00162019C1
MERLWTKSFLLIEAATDVGIGFGTICLDEFPRTSATRLCFDAVVWLLSFLLPCS